MIKIIKYPEKSMWTELLKRPIMDNAALEDTVNAVIDEVAINGDKALKKFTQRFDKVEIETMQVSDAEFEAAEKNISENLKVAIQLAKSNIEKFHIAQKEVAKDIETMPGVKCWRKSIAIQKIGLYIPGGSAPLFSTVLMLGVPAVIAGCEEIVLCTPPDKAGKINAAILYTAKLVGIKKVFKVGGVQAIAAMAFGTETIPKTYKIFGPGNQYVTCAKQLVNKMGVAIDMPAGPSEVAIIADESCNPAFVAADLLSQAEHGADSQVILVSTSEEVIQKVNSELELQIAMLPRKEIAMQALQNSKSILVKTLEQGIDLLNEYAPEHLIIACKNEDEIGERVINAGSVFLGNYSCESAGDYASGTNHTLPTNGYAKAYSGVSLDSFVKKVTFQKITEEGVRSIGGAIELMAAAEGLDAHKNAVTLRLNSINKI
jgi:histidinol dehydrogenase